MNKIVEYYDIQDLMDTGIVGEVRRAIHCSSGKECAVKKLEKANFTKQCEEVSILQSLSHPYIVEFIEVVVSTTHIYFVMEFMPSGDLFNRIIEKGKFTEVGSRRVLRRILAAIYYLHEECDVVHRDIKPENILCMDSLNDVHVKLTDFGLAKFIENGLLTLFGIPQYFTPEVLRCKSSIKESYGKAADMWSLGVLAYILISGVPPFNADCFLRVTW